jgi:hypothetical protein
LILVVSLSNHAAAYCAAAINSVHRSVAKALSVPTLIYGPQTEVPARTDAVLLALKALLSK